MLDTMTAKTPFNPDEIGAMRFAYQTMRQEYPNRYVSETDKRDLARSVINAMGNPRLADDQDTISAIVNETL